MDLEKSIETLPGLFNLNEPPEPTVEKFPLMSPIKIPLYVIEVITGHELKLVPGTARQKGTIGTRVLENPTPLSAGKVAEI